MSTEDIAQVKKIGAIVSIAILIFSACTEDISAPVVEQTPQIVLIQAPRTIYQFPAQPTGIHVRATDAQGVFDLFRVTLSVKRLSGEVIRTRQLMDDGDNGDILAGDGQFFALLDTALVRNQTGEFVLEATAVDRSQNQSAAARDTVQVLAGVENRLPVIEALTAPAVIIIGSSNNYSFLARASDPDGAGMVSHVTMESYASVSRQPARVDTLRDDGLHGDGVAGDGVFGLLLSASSFGGQCGGFYSLVFRARDHSGGLSPAESQTLELQRDNTAPIVSELSAPFTISRSATPNTYVLSIKAEDRDGACDALTRVFFNSFRPDGSAATGNPFAMRDDGQGGDAAAGDGRFSLTIQITTQNALGAYRFEFQAQDRAGALSNKIIHTITVTQ